MGFSDFVVSRDDWSLHRKGQLDQQRHQEKVREAIKRNLSDIVAEESIIMSDGNKVIKVPIRSLDEYRFRFDYRKQNHAGEGNGDSKVGDRLGADPASGQGKGKGAGAEPGVDYYEAEVTVDELAEMVFEDLGLPNLQRKKRQELVTESIQFNDVRKKGLMSNIDKKRTILETIKRNALAGHPGLNPITPDDLRFKTWEVSTRPESSAVVLAMMDTSASMGTFEKYMARSFFFWMVRFLRTKYQHVQIVFLAHDVDAREVTEEEFFSKGESGGTRCSSVYELALEVIEKRFNPEDYNIYPFHFSDGDNLPSDNELCVKLVQKLLEVCNIFGYGEITDSYFEFYRVGTLQTALEKISDPKLASITIRDKNDVLPALRTFFSRKNVTLG